VLNQELDAEVCLKIRVILPIPCQYILSLLNFVVNNQQIFHRDSAVHSINTRNEHHLHGPNANLSYFQQGAFYTGIRIFNSLLHSFTDIREWGKKANITSVWGGGGLNLP
jgi:hypothetical protein